MEVRSGYVIIKRGFPESEAVPDNDEIQVVAMCSDDKNRKEINIIL